MPLRDDLTLVELLVDEVHRRAGEPHAGRHDGLVHVVPVHALSPERGEQRGMDVEHLVLVRSAQLRRDEPEVPREEYVPHAGVAKLRDERVRGQAVCFFAVD